MSPRLQYTDQMGHEVNLPRIPKRIVSLVPSQTELLYYLGIVPVGQTIFCIHPADKFKVSTKIGGTKKLQTDKIMSLKPDLIIGNKEENDKDQIETLKEDFPVWISDVNTLDEAYQMVQSIGEMVGKPTEATALNRQIKEAFSRLLVPNSPNKRVLYLIWQEPFYGVANNTFIGDIMNTAGYDNVLKHLERYPELSAENIQKLEPDLIFLSTEPYPFKQSHCHSLAKQLPNSKVILVNGEAFSWYGNRLLHTPYYIESLNSDIREYES